MTTESRHKERLQLGFLFFVTFFLISVLFFTSSLRAVTLLTILNVLILSPVIQFLSSRKIPKLWGILIVYAFLTLFFLFGVTRLIQVISVQWSGFIDSLPSLSEAVLSKVDELEARLKEQFAIDVDLGTHQGIIQWISQIRTWALTHIPAMIGNLASAALLVPVFSFFILKDGEKFTHLYLQLIPKRFSRTVISVIAKISVALGTFLRAKLFEALLFGFMTYLGLILIKAPYAGLFALIGGLLNLIPYLGPMIGAAPPLLVFAFSSAHQHLFWPAVILLITVNLIDNFLVFPIFVARIVNLTPLTLLLSVAVGQEFYGIAGMLLAVPIASILKIIYLELQPLLYK
ncbi:MAG: AI-2E family transporter [Bdellovibrionales bacterium]|nr:AI-2E family transporter [Bdellovibrionales bacterium]